MCGSWWVKGPPLSPWQESGVKLWLASVNDWPSPAQKMLGFGLDSLKQSVIGSFLMSKSAVHVLLFSWFYPNKIWIVVNFWKILCKVCIQFGEIVFCFKNCSDLLWEKIVLVIEKNFWNSRLKVENFQNFWDHSNNLFKQWNVRRIFGNRMLF